MLRIELSERCLRVINIQDAFEALNFGSSFTTSIATEIIFHFYMCLYIMRCAVQSQTTSYIKVGQNFVQSARITVCTKRGTAVAPRRN